MRISYLVEQNNFSGYLQLLVIMSDSYQIKVDEINRRTSPKLVPEDQQITEKWGKIFNKKENFVLVPNSYNTRIFDGPKRNLKLLAIWRYYAAGTIPYFYTSISIMDMDGDLLKPEIIFETMEPSATKIRNIAVHPNCKQLIILSEVRVGKYQLRQLVEDDRTYEMILVKQHSFTSTSYDDLQYHPSGEFLVAIKQKKEIGQPIATELYPTKLDAKSLNFTSGQNIMGKCLSMSRFLIREIIAIDKNQPYRAFIGNNMSTVCFWDLYSANFTISFQTLDDNLYTYPDIGSTHTISANITIKGISYLNQTKDGYLVGFDPTRRIGILLSQHSKSMPDSFVFSYHTNADFIVKCIDIDHINAFACFRVNSDNLSIMKLDRRTNQSVDLYSESTSNQQFKIEGIFYHEKSSEFCRIYKQSMECFKIYTKCIPKRPLSSIGDCQQECSKTKNIKSFWNPVSMTCEPCNNTCKCSKPHETFNPYYRSCVLDCSKIPYAFSSSVYANHSKCVCQSPYQWFHDLQQCRINCSTVKFSLHHQDTEKVSVSQCQCPPNFIYSPKHKSDAPGECILNCHNGKSPLHNRNNQPYCVCEKDQKWHPHKYQCISLAKKQDSLPIWGIVLILVGVFIVTAVIGFLVKKMWDKSVEKKENQKKEAAGDDKNQQGGQQSDRQLSSKQKKNHHVQFQDKICAVCNKQESRVNCKAPCGHYFHFFCIKERIEEGQAQCPQCFKVLHKGVADLQLVQNEDEIITISDNDN